jgi:hypothetical protein
MAKGSTLIVALGAVAAAAAVGVVVFGGSSSSATVLPPPPQPDPPKVPPKVPPKSPPKGPYRPEGAPSNFLVYPTYQSLVSKIANTQGCMLVLLSNGYPLEMAYKSVIATNMYGMYPVLYYDGVMGADIHPIEQGKIHVDGRTAHVVYSHDEAYQTLSHLPGILRDTIDILNDNCSSQD